MGIRSSEYAARALPFMSMSGNDRRIYPGPQRSSGEGPIVQNPDDLIDAGLSTYQPSGIEGQMVLSIAGSLAKRSGRGLKTSSRVFSKIPAVE
jgi:hypothetical protein